MTENKTKPGTMPVDTFLNGIDHVGRHADAIELLALMEKATGLTAEIWGDSMVGFGRYDYTYDSGHSGTWFRVGFAPRKADMVVYIMPGFAPFQHHLEKLGNHKHSKSCLYLGRLKNIDLVVLSALITDSLKLMNERYPV